MKRCGPAPLLGFNDVALVRGGRMLFVGVAFDLMPGDLVWLRGPNGVGKSSLLRAAAGLLRPFAGSIDRPARVALADEALALDADQPLGRALGFWARIDGADNTATAASLDALALGPLADVPVRLLSTGQRRRAGLARLLACGAPVWLLDEPANGLDQLSQAMLETSIAAHRTRGGAVLLASHQPVAVGNYRDLELQGVAA